MLTGLIITTTIGLVSCYEPTEKKTEDVELVRYKLEIAES